MFMQPQKKLADKAISYWRVQEVLFAVVCIIIFCGLFLIANYFNWFRWIQFVFVGILILVIFACIISWINYPKRFANFRFDFDEKFFYLKDGIWNKSWTVIPFTKIQAVTFGEGLLLQHFGAASIEVQTIGKIYTIPILKTDEAKQLHEQLVHLAIVEEAE